MHSDVLIVGAGPTGLVLGLWLTRLGIHVRIIDKKPAAETTSRALAVQARTLELYRQLDLTGTVLAHGHKVPAVNLWAKGLRAARVPFEAIGADLTPYPYLQIFSQDQHEHLLIERLEAAGVRIERATEAIGLEVGGDPMRVHVRGPDGQESLCEASFVAGCDGARSVIRESIGTGFPGGTYRQIFYVADVDATGPVIDGELHIDLDEADFLGVFPLAGQGRVRLVGTVRDERADTLKFDDVGARAIEHLKIGVRNVNWFSTYHVHHRVTDQFRKGRVFLLGDAAHIHSPAGGQGMNTGIGDAINLAWKLAAVLTGQSDESLLDSYQADRMPFARKLVATTDRVFSFATAEGRIADIIRTRIAPLIFPKALALDAVREFVFKTVSQIALNYRNSPLSAGVAAQIHGGDRLPWAPVDDIDNFASLTTMSWQVHVYGAATAELRSWCADRGVPLHVFEWRGEYAAAGFSENALYLLRPDTYIALVDASGTAGAIDAYGAARGIRFDNVRCS